MRGARGAPLLFSPGERPRARPPAGGTRPPSRGTNRVHASLKTTLLVALRQYQAWCRAARLLGGAGVGLAVAMALLGPAAGVTAQSTPRPRTRPAAAARPTPPAPPPPADDSLAVEPLPVAS